MNRLPPIERLYYQRVVGLYESYFRRRMVFANHATLRLIGRPPAMRGKPYLRRLLDYCLRAGYLGSALPGVDEALAELGATPSA